MHKNGYSLAETLVSLVIVGTVMAGALPVISVKMKLNEEEINGQIRAKTWTRTANDNGIYYNDGVVGINVNKDFIRETGAGAPKYRLTIGTPGTNNTLNFLNPGVSYTKPLTPDGVSHTIGGFSIASPTGIVADSKGKSMQYIDPSQSGTDGDSADDPDSPVVEPNDGSGLVEGGSNHYFRYRIKTRTSDEEPEEQTPSTPAWSELSSAEKEAITADYLKSIGWPDFWANYYSTYPMYQAMAAAVYEASRIISGGDTDLGWSDWSAWAEEVNDPCQASPYNDSSQYKCESYYAYSSPKESSNVTLGGKENYVDYSIYSAVVGGQYNTIDNSKFSVIYNSVGDIITNANQAVMINNNQGNGMSVPGTIPVSGLENCKIDGASNSVIANSTNSRITGSIENSVILNSAGAEIEGTDSVMVNASGKVSGVNSVVVNGRVSDLKSNNCFVTGDYNNIYDTAHNSITAGRSNRITGNSYGTIIVGDGNTATKGTSILIGDGNSSNDTAGIKIGDGLNDGKKFRIGFDKEKFIQINSGLHEGLYIKRNNDTTLEPTIDNRTYYSWDASHNMYVRDKEGNYVGKDYNLRSDPWGSFYHMDSYSDGPKSDDDNATDDKYYEYNAYKVVAAIAPYSSYYVKVNGYICPLSKVYIEYDSSCVDQDADAKYYDIYGDTYALASDVIDDITDQAELDKLIGLQLYSRDSNSEVQYREHTGYYPVANWQRYDKIEALAYIEYDYSNGFQYYTRSSDRRLKNILGEYDSGLTDILALSPVSFKYKKDTGYKDLDPNETHQGFIAQDVKKVYPKTVEKDKKGFLFLETVSLYEKIVLSLINSAKEMNARCEKLKAKNEKLKEDIELIEARIKELEK